MTRQISDAVLRPGPVEWELWKFPAKGDPVCELNPTKKSTSGAQRVVLALPARDVLALPLWISTQANPAELAELELSSRHLLRRNAAVQAIPIETRENRALVLALTSSDDADAAPYFSLAREFEASARLWESGDADVVVWRELGELCFSFFLNGKCVFFSATGETSPGPAFCGALTRAAVRLKSEAVLNRLPAKARVYGGFSEAELTSLASELRVDVESVSGPTPPTLPTLRSNPAPPVAKIAESQRNGRNKLAKIGAAVAIVYLVFVAALATETVLRSLTLTRLRAEQADIAPEAEAAQKAVTEWREFRHAVDPLSYAIDQLAAVAREIPADQVRLTQFSLENGRLLVAGEAADVGQAYAFSEKIRASPALADYDWTARQPQLAGKSKVRFEMEGVRPDAKIDIQ